MPDTHLHLNYQGDVTEWMTPGRMHNRFGQPLLQFTSMRQLRVIEAAYDADEDRTRVCLEVVVPDSSYLPVEAAAR